MTALLRLFWNICLLRQPPQDVPASWTLFLLVLSLNLVIDSLRVSEQVGLPQAVVLILIYSGALLGVIVLLLGLLGHLARAQQTLTALLGSGLLITLCILPVEWVMALFPGSEGMFGFLLLFLYVWSLIVTAHILRHALSVKFFFAAVLSLGYFMLSFRLASLLIPQVG